MSDWTVVRNELGRWCYIDAQGQRHEPVTVARAFPIAQPDQLISILDADGHELAWIDDLKALDANLAHRIREAVNEREFLPEIQAVIAVSRFVTPCEWTVKTHRGESTFVLQGEEDVRRISGDLLIVSDKHGVQYLIRSLSKLDRASRKLLDRFL
ncbi:MAG: hypothetical protein RL111_918 [Pseudomonadota bacterium]|jgi:hypothetical protein